MRQLLVLACLLGVAAAFSPIWSRVQGRNNKLSAADAVKDIKNRLIDVAQKMQRFCHAHSKRTFKQAYTAKYYTLSANLTGCSEDGLSVRAGQRLIALQVRNKRCDFVALQLLPDVVDPTSAFWRLQKEQLTVYFPYDLDFGQCGRTVSNSVHSLPQFDDDTNYPDVDVKFDVNVDTKSILKSHQLDQLSSQTKRGRKGRDSWEDFTD